MRHFPSFFAYQNSIKKKNQCGILAQKILFCGNLQAEFFVSFYSSLESIIVSSSALVNAARSVQYRPWCAEHPLPFRDLNH